MAFVDETGAPLKVGSSGRLEGGESFTVGYDGIAYLRGLAERNTVLVELPDGRQCKATFSYAPNRGKRVFIDHVVCGKE